MKDTEGVFFKLQSGVTMEGQWKLQGKLSISH